jgi:hypothetical protein
MLTSSRREVLKLYRHVWRMTRHFDYPNEKGELWRDVLRRSAREEFEASKYLTDPEEILRKIIIGNEALAQLEERVSYPHPLAFLTL